MAAIAPVVRISRTRGSRRSGASSSTMILPTTFARSTSFSSFRTCSVARPDAHEIGFPPKVEPWVDVRHRSCIARGARIAPSGSPPPSAFARVITSGVTPNRCAANHAPVRPKPVWTSSKMRSAPIRVASSRSPCRKDAGGATYPPSPSTGSMRIAATCSAGPSWSSICSICASECCPQVSASCAGVIGQSSGYGYGATWISGRSAP